MLLDMTNYKMMANI